jgi:riboflavin synthase
VAVVPHTAAVTTLGAMAAGALVNLEVDVIAKYVQRLLAAGADTPYRSGASASSER